MKFKNILLIVLFLFVANCGGDPTDRELDSEQSLLNQNRSLWIQNEINNYQYTLSIGCFCVPQEDVIINVVDGQVESAFFTPSGVYLDDNAILDRNIAGIDGLFDLVQDSIDDQVSSLTVDYDIELGYPLRIFIDLDVRIADDETSYTISDFQ